MAEEAEPEKPRGFLQNVVDVYFAPRDGFASIVRRPNFWLPLGCRMLVALLFVAVWMHKVDPAEFMKARLEESSRWEKVPAESRAGIVETQAKVLPIIS